VDARLPPWHGRRPRRSTLPARAAWAATWPSWACESQAVTGWLYMAWAETRGRGRLLPIVFHEAVEPQCCCANGQHNVSTRSPWPSPYADHDIVARPLPRLKAHVDHDEVEPKLRRHVPKLQKHADRRHINHVGGDRQADTRDRQPERRIGRQTTQLS
jgi:hypothetical protein